MSENINIQKMKEITVDEKKPPSKNFFVELREGNFGLAMTYWVYGVLASFVWGVGIFTINADPLGKLNKIIWVFFAGYYFYVYLGIWFAANKYEGSRVWAVLAKFSVVIIVLPIIINSLKYLGDPNY